MILAILDDRIKQEAAMDRFHSSLYEMKHYLSGGGDEYGCCGLQFEKIIPGIALVAVSYFLFFLLNRANNQRRKRDTSLQNEQSISTSEGYKYLCISMIALLIISFIFLIHSVLFYQLLVGQLFFYLETEKV